jgi:hypothetical protein
LPENVVAVPVLAQTIERSLESLVESDRDIGDLVGMLISTGEIANGSETGPYTALDALLAGHLKYEGLLWVQWGRLEAYTHYAFVEHGLTPQLFELITIVGERCGIERENHGSWGYHYHYVDDKRRRSDVIFSFLPTDTKTPPRLWWERHAEGKAEVSPDVLTWGASKRTSIHRACERDLTKRRLADYKRPSKEALVLWPIP